ncbi:hypothetical protein M422DRAFT_24205 [Sphaerobolus stellatus SS14]|nr:hypothetical protein M422DRAFT_24205 [Sphaerobolus stellatus SS14]
MPRAVEDFETSVRILTGSNPHLANHACITLNMSDRLRLIRFPPHVVDRIRVVLERKWLRGIQSERGYANTHEFKLHGNPWDGVGIEGIGSRLVIMAVLAILYHQGWQLVMSVDISKKLMDKDSLIFREGPLPSPSEFISVSFNQGDRIRIMSEDIPPEALNTIRVLLGQTVQDEEWKN